MSRAHRATALLLLTVVTMTAESSAQTRRIFWGDEVPASWSGRWPADLLTVPELAKRDWRMTMLTPEYQLQAPFFLGGQDVWVAYPTDTMPHDKKLMALRGNNRHFSRAVVHHELIPGHHLQYFYNSRYQTHRELFDTPFWTEGWALYWEFRLWDRGFAKTPEDKIGMLFWRSHRAARILFSLGFHLGKMTPDQAVDLLVERVGHERENARAEVRRSFAGDYGPLYQIAYMIGALEIYSMRAEMVDSGKMGEKEFHDLIMSQNATPHIHPEDHSKLRGGGYLKDGWSYLMPSDQFILDQEVGIAYADDEIDDHVREQTDALRALYLKDSASEVATVATGLSVEALGGKSVSFFVKRGLQVVGCAKYDETTATMTDVVIRPSARDSKVGEALVGAVRSHARKLGRSGSLYVKVSTSGESNNFFEQLGFEEVKGEEHHKMDI